jgi:hypothetical protein
MALPGYRQSYSRGAYLLSLIGGILIVLGGVVSMVEVSSLSDVLNLGLGALGLILGILILFGAFQIKNHPETSRTWGILIIVFSLVSYLGGAGFILGLILGLVGGLLAYLWRPVAPTPTYGVPMTGQPMPGGPAGVPSAPFPSPPPAIPPAPPGGSQFCQFCGSPMPAGAKFCPKCGAASPGS